MFKCVIIWVPYFVFWNFIHWPFLNCYPEAFENSLNWNYIHSPTALHITKQHTPRVLLVLRQKVHRSNEIETEIKWKNYCRMHARLTVPGCIPTGATPIQNATKKGWNQSVCEIQNQQKAANKPTHETGKFIFIALSQPPALLFRRGSESKN